MLEKNRGKTRNSPFKETVSRAMSGITVRLDAQRGFREKLEMPSSRLLQLFCTLTLGSGSGDRKKWMDSIDTYIRL